MPDKHNIAPTEADQAEELQLSLYAAYSESLPEEYHAPAVLLGQSILKSMMLYERFAKQYGLTYNGLLVLLCLRLTDGASQGGISKLLWLPKQTVGSLLNGFKKKGYVSETPSPRDARSKIVSLTEEGKAFADPLFKRLHELDSMAVTSVSLEDLRAAVDSVDAYASAFEQALDKS